MSRVLVMGHPVFDWFAVEDQKRGEKPRACRASVRVGTIGGSHRWVDALGSSAPTREENQRLALEALELELAKEGACLISRLPGGDEDEPPAANLSEPEPPPVPSGEPVWDMVIADMQERDRFGEAKYGQRLLTRDGRNTLVDAYQESLDLVVYMRKAIEDAKRQGENALDAYQREAAEMACDSIRDDIVYFVMGIGGEAGEVLELHKKSRRDILDGVLSLPATDMVKKELGDVLWYVSQLARCYGLSLSDVAATNIEKLRSRKERGVINGSGDDR